VRTAQQGVPHLGHLYRETRERLTSLLREFDGDALTAMVPACPGWRVRDVVCHIVANVEDALAGGLTIPPSEEDTAAQLARCANRDMGEMLETWAALAPSAEQVIGALSMWPAVIDVATHEQDIRGAVGRPGARDTRAIWHCAGWLITDLRTPIALAITVEDGEFIVGPPGTIELALATSRYQSFRWRMGRRSRTQLAGLNWSGDPAPVLDHLCVFGPASSDIIE
jgi:uncharacterized protein (TIGR03083 family)